MEIQVLCCRVVRKAFQGASRFGYSRRGPVPPCSGKGVSPREASSAGPTAVGAEQEAKTC